MGDSIVLDPYDMWQLTSHLKTGFGGLFEKYIGLHVEDGLILPNLKQDGEEEKCAFLNDEGRCDIHTFRPGICRLFPLGRIYDESGFHYIHQIYECPQKDKTKVKIKKWLGISDLKKYEQLEINDLIIRLPKNISEIILAKHRGGSTGTVKLSWLPSYTKFGNLDRIYGEERV